MPSANMVQAASGVFVRAASLILLNPDADQLARQIMPLGEPVKALTGNALLLHLLCERCLTMAFIFRKPNTHCQLVGFNLSGSRGALHGSRTKHGRIILRSDLS
jgi:hypothetical protein